jgi:hypothetical protein
MENSYKNDLSLLFKYITDGRFTESDFIENFEFILSVSRLVKFSPEYGYYTILLVIRKFCPWFWEKNRSSSLKTFLRLRGNELPDITAGGKIKWNDEV